MRQLIGRRDGSGMAHERTAGAGLATVFRPRGRGTGFRPAAVSQRHPARGRVADSAVSLRAFRSWMVAAATAVVGSLLAACANVPRQISPTVLALPAHGEKFAVFEQHDRTCRQYASTEVGAQSPGGVAEHSAAAGAVAGAGVGAVAGALLGSASGNAGHGAAVGAGTGLLTGLLLGSAKGGASAAAIQSRYNMSYTQCMVGHGERIERPASPQVIYAIPSGTVVVPPPPPPPPPYAAEPGPPP